MRRGKFSGILCGALLAAATFAAYFPVRDNPFIAVDDDTYIVGNPVVRRGLTRAGVAWALTATHAGNWHPLTWISHMADVSLFGLNPGAHHLMSLSLHVVNALALLVLLARITGRLRESALVAALFALHPLHVESVAWAAERKDVLSAFFFLATLLAYVRYAARPGSLRYLPVPALLILGLGAKPMLVTLPFLLLLLDGWPLGRFRQARAGHLVLEKVPLLLISLASSVVTFLAQRTGGAMDLVGPLPFLFRLGHALVAYIDYLGKTFWPARLALFYPHTGLELSWGRVIVAAAVVAGLSLLALAQARRRPWLAVGWFWYLGTLVPVIGLVQVGTQAMADRYTYIPLIGFFLVLVWGAAEPVRRRHIRALAAAVTLGLLLACARLTYRQAELWRDGEGLIRHALAVIRDNWAAHYTLGVSLELSGRTKEAVVEYREALRIRPAYVWAHNNLGRLLAQEGRLPESIAHFESAVRIRPQTAMLRLNLGLALETAGRLEAAAQEYAEAARLDPRDPLARLKATEYPSRR